MDFVITPKLTQLVFEKVGRSMGNPILETPEQQEAFTLGLVDYLQKEANLDAFMALGFLHFVAQRGADYMATDDKTAAEDFAQVEEQFFKEADGFWDNTVNPVKQWVGEKIVAPLARPVVDDSIRRNMAAQVEQVVGDIPRRIGDMGQKAWGYMKSPEFLKGVAPWVVGGLGGYLLPKLLSGGQSSTATNLAGAAGGAALGGAIGNQITGGQTINQASTFLDNLRKQNANIFRNPLKTMGLKE